MIMEEKFNMVKQKAAELKTGIEELLKKFRNETGYTPEIKVETKVKPTNDRTLVSQTVGVTVTVQ
jgi:hypothetical protein